MEYKIEYTNGQPSDWQEIESFTNEYVDNNPNSSANDIEKAIINEWSFDGGCSKEIESLVVIISSPEGAIELLGSLLSSLPSLPSWEEAYGDCEMLADEIIFRIKNEWHDLRNLLNSNETKIRDWLLGGAQYQAFEQALKMINKHFDE